MARGKRCDVKMKERQWNRRYLAYAAAHGHGAEEMLARDAERWPGGKMCGFMLWVQARWRTWAKEAGEHPEWGGGWSARQHAAFDAWLARCTGLPLAPPRATSVQSSGAVGA